jgi:hypothetical protein
VARALHLKQSDGPLEFSASTLVRWAWQVRIDQGEYLLADLGFLTNLEHEELNRIHKGNRQLRTKQSLFGWRQRT